MGWDRSLGLLGAISLARVAFGYQVQTVASIGPDLLAAFGISLAVLGTLIGLYMALGIVAAVPCGFLGQRFGDRTVIGAGLGMMALGSAISALSGGPVGLGAGRLVAGAGAVALTVLQGKVVADRFQGRSFLLAMGLSVGAFPIGIGLGQLTHARLAHEYGWPAPFLAGAAVAAVAGAWLVAAWGRRFAPGRGGMRLPSRHECLLVLVAGLTWTFYNAGYFNFVAFMPTYLAAHGHPTWIADVVVAVATWGNLPSILLGSGLALRFGTDRMFLFGAVLNTVAVIGMGLLDWPLLWGTLFGTLGSAHAGIIFARGTLSARPENRAVGMGLFYTTYYVGGAFIPALCGRAADAVGDPRGAFLCAGVLGALTIPAYFLHGRMQASARGAQARLMLHLMKLSVGSPDVAELRAWQVRRAADDPPLRHLTRNFPRRAAEVMQGGSMYWVVAGIVAVRQRILDIAEDARLDGSRCAALVLDCELVVVAGRPMRPFQGWRYLEPDAAPPDLATLAGGGEAGLPPKCNRNCIGSGCYEDRT